MRIQHNIMAMNAYRNLSNNNSALSKNLEKLSSGYKINRAGDDAAGLAISEKMRAQITGLDTAQKNVKDGISLVQTAEGALTEVHDMLNRMVELANQSANGTYADDVDRENLQAEIDQLKDEIDRIADSSNFNGINLLDGSQNNSTAVIGAEDVTVTAIHDGQLGKEPQAGIYELDLSNYSFTAGDEAATLTINLFGTNNVQVKVAKGETVTGEDIAAEIASKFKSNTLKTKYGVDEFTATADGSKVTLTMSNAPTKEFTEASGFTISDGSKKGTANNAEGIEVRTIQEAVDTTTGRKYAQGSFDLADLDIQDGSVVTIGDTSYTFAVGAKSEYKNVANVIDLTDMTADQVTNKLATVAGRLTTAAKDNSNFKVTSDTQSSVIKLTELEGGVDTDDYKLAGDDDTNDTDGDWTGFVKFGQYDVANSTSALRLQIGDTSDSFNQLVVAIGDTHTDSLGIDKIDISTQQGAADAVDVIKAAINKVSSIRGTLGAAQNRLDHTANNLSVMEENITDAESTIRDTDVAEEMMAYTKNNILIQSAQAMLAQANQVPQGVLQLMG